MQDNFKMGFEEIGYAGLDLIQLAQDGFIDGLSSAQQSTFVFHTRQQISLPTACLSGFQERICSVECSYCLI
jgi:hypothetical protein